MDSRLSRFALSRLLALNNQAHDLDRQLKNIRLPGSQHEVRGASVFTPNTIGDLQDDFDRTVRASLVTCWLADSRAPEG